MEVPEQRNGSSALLGSGPSAGSGNSDTQNSGNSGTLQDLEIRSSAVYPFRWGPFEGPSQKEGVTMHDATKCFDIETLLKAGLPKTRVAEIAGVSVWTVHRVRAETESRLDETDKAASEADPEAPPGPA